MDVVSYFFNDTPLQKINRFKLILKVQTLINKFIQI